MSTNYHRRILGEANAGGLHEFRVSPLHYYDWATGPDKDVTEPMRDGRLFHMALHEPERFAREVYTIPNMPLRSKSDREAFLNTILDASGVPIVDDGSKADDLRSLVHSRCEASGVSVMTDDALATLRRMVTSLNIEGHRIPRALVANGKKEVELRWKDPDSGVQCKALLDSWDEQNGVLSDLKRTDAITTREWKFKVLGMGYDYQMAWYRRALRAHGADPRYCPFVCGSPSRPHPWAVYSLPQDRLDFCDLQHSMYLLTLAECMSTGTWPTINNGEPVELEIRAT